VRTTMIKKLACLMALALASTAPAYAFTYGIQANYGTGHLLKSAPRDIDGGGLQFSIQPDNWQWGILRVYLEANENYWHTSSTSANNNIWITAIAPVARLTFFRNNKVSPFIEGSVGASIMSATHFGDRDLGINFAFQDIGGIGVAFGKNHQVDATLRAIHYSNASIAKHNSGITVPVDFQIGYWFS